MHVCQVPKDAHFIDLVFSDTGDQHGGFFDNNGGLDYHIPVAGAEGQLKPLHVVHVTVEMAPIAKVGGLADVVTALGRAVQDEGHHVEAIIPKYDVLDYDQVVGLEKARGFHFGGAFVEAWKGKVSCSLNAYILFLGHAQKLDIMCMPCSWCSRNAAARYEPAV